MECKISLPDEQVKKILGQITKSEFARFCKEAVTRKLFESQFSANPSTKPKKQLDRNNTEQ